MLLIFFKCFIVKLTASIPLAFDTAPHNCILLGETFKLIFLTVVAMSIMIEFLKNLFLFLIIPLVVLQYFIDNIEPILSHFGNLNFVVILVLAILTFVMGNK